MSSLSDIDNYFSTQPEPVKGCLLALRTYILQYTEGMQETWKYRMPGYSYKGKMFCYLWTDKKTGEPYILMVEGNRITHPSLDRGDRARMSILPIKANEDLPLATIHEVFQEALTFYK